MQNKLPNQQNDENGDSGKDDGGTGDGGDMRRQVVGSFLELRHAQQYFNGHRRAFRISYEIVLLTVCLTMRS